MAFKVGDIVQLKSGGPKMTVVQVSSASVLYASWFAGAKNERASFHPDALILAPDEGKK